MKKLALMAVLAATVAMPVYAADAVKTEAAPAAGAEAKPLKLKAGGWVKVDDKGMAWASKDDGKTWAKPGAGTWELEDGTKVMTDA